MWLQATYQAFLRACFMVPKNTENVVAVDMLWLRGR